MKILILIAFCLTIPNSGKSQLFSRESTRGAALGGILGGIIGHNSGRKTAEGIGIGAGTGWLLGNLARNHRERGAYDTYIPSRRQSVYADSAPAATRPNYAITGAAVGGLAGAIIGHNQGRKTMEGLGIGAASGLLVGGLAEHATRQRESRHYYAHEAPPRYSVRFHGNAPVAVQTRSPVVVTQQQPVVYVQPAQPPTVFKRVTTSSTTGNSQGAGNRTTQPIQAQTVVINNYYLNNQPAGSPTTLPPAWK